MLKMLQGIGWLLLSGALWAVEPPPPPLVASAESVTATPIWGLVETICLATEGVQLEAKLDTGADTSSLDARDIQAFDREGEPWVRFRVEGVRDSQAVSQLVERPVERRVKVRSASGSDSRYVVRMRVMFGSQEYDEQFSLRDRRRMNYPVLIGSRTLKHLGAVDVNRMHTQMPRCQP
ncbi:ATP-dependent zinc protease family protein [Pseudaeromonas pectinilytica]|nr:ATP-dependent zinc protease [Aeromonadaceae bacterium]MBP8772809.1 ATP-dependent zinc protease [Aeromonadaceae bacterium]